MADRRIQHTQLRQDISDIAYVSSMPMIIRNEKVGIACQNGSDITDSVLGLTKQTEVIKTLLKESGASDKEIDAQVQRMSQAAIKLSTAFVNDIETALK